MAHVLKDSMNHYAIEVKRGPKHVHCIVRLASEVEYKSYPLTKMITDHENNTNDGTYQFDRRWETIAYPDAATEDDRRVAGIKELLHVVDNFLNGMLPITSKARRWLEALRNYPMASEPLPDSTQPTKGDVTLSTKKAKVKKAPKAKKARVKKVKEDGYKKSGFREGSKAAKALAIFKADPKAERKEMIEAIVKKAGCTPASAASLYFNFTS